MRHFKSPTEVFYPFTSGTACCPVRTRPIWASCSPGSGWTPADCEGTNPEGRTPLGTQKPPVRIRASGCGLPPRGLTHAPQRLHAPQSCVPLEELLQDSVQGATVHGAPHFQHHGAVEQPANQQQPGGNRWIFFSPFQSFKGNFIHSILPTFVVSPGNPDKHPG